LLFPRAFEDKVNYYTKRLDLDPDLILAIIRQESVFNPRARSQVGARGLMQLMPATAVVEVKKLSQGYMPLAQRKQLLTHSGDASQLFDAETNVAIGVHHASRLLQKYRNAIFLLTSYNANPRATERWMQNIPSDDMLTFIERIPYAETKAYVKLVLRNYFYYKRWYGDVHEPLPHLDLLTSVLGKTEAPL
jgi:soluble lytic murein transglycosylase